MKYLFLFLFLIPLLAPVHETVNSKQIRVVVLDTGLDIDDPRFKGHICPNESRDFTGKDLYDRYGHGTHIASLILKNASTSNFCLIIVKWWIEENTRLKNMDNYKKAVDYVVSLNPNIVNMSLSGTEEIDNEEHMIKSLPNTKFIVSAGNDGKDQKVQLSYPAALTFQYRNVIVVGSLDVTGNRYKSSNYGYPNMRWRKGENIDGYSVNRNLTVKMSGTSQAAAQYTGEYIGNL